MTTILHRKLQNGETKSWSTSGNFRGGKIVKICLHCNNEYSVFNYRKDESRFCSRNCSASYRVGELGRNWRGGLSSLDKLIRGGEYYNTWRKSVYKRDNWTCQHCNVKQKHPIAHHIKPFKDFIELRFDINNGLTLCRSCHKKVHTEIGYDTRFGRNGSNGVLTVA